MEPVNRSRAGLTDNERLPAAAVCIDLPDFSFQRFMNSRIPVPLRIQIDAHDIHLPVNPPAGPFQQRRRDRAALIQLPQQGKDRPIAFRAKFRIICAFIQAAPDEYAWMIHVLLHHFPGRLHHLLHEQRMTHLCLRQTPGMGFLPYQHSHFIAEIQKTGIIGIMTGTHTIGAHMAHQLDILYHAFQRYGSTEAAILLMPVEAPQLNRFTVQQNLLPFRPDLPEARPVDPVIHSLSADGHPDFHGI